MGERSRHDAEAGPHQLRPLLQVLNALGQALVPSILAGQDRVQGWIRFNRASGCCELQSGALPAENLQSHSRFHANRYEKVLSCGG